MTPDDSPYLAQTHNAFQWLSASSGIQAGRHQAFQLADMLLKEAKNSQNAVMLFFC
jgi:hypothetical protein